MTGEILLRWSHWSAHSHVACLYDGTRHGKSVIRVACEHNFETAPARLHAAKAEVVRSAPLAAPLRETCAVDWVLVHSSMQSIQTSWHLRVIHTAHHDDRLAVMTNSQVALATTTGCSFSLLPRVTLSMNWSPGVLTLQAVNQPGKAPNSEGAELETIPTIYQMEHQYEAIALSKMAKSSLE